MPPKPRKTSKVMLNLQQKLEIIKKLEKGTTVAQICDKYGCKKQTVSDIRKTKEKLRSYATKFSIDSSASKRGKVTARKYMKTGKINLLDEGVMKWYLSQKSVGLNVRGVEIMAAAQQIAEKLNINDFKASSGWLWRFRNRHGLFKLNTVKYYMYKVGLPQPRRKSMGFTRTFSMSGLLP